MSIVFNGMRKMLDDKGKYIVLIDYGQEGISIGGQFATIQAAIECCMEGSVGECAIVKLVKINTRGEEL